MEAPTSPDDPAAQARLIEISADRAPAQLSLAIEWLLEAQRHGDPAAWIQPAQGRLYPPDLERNGVDLAALLVVQVPPAAGGQGALRAAEILLRSGAFGVLVLDFLAGVPPHAAAWQGRLLGLMRRHRTSVLVLTHKSAAMDSLGPLCSLRLQASRALIGQRFALVTHTLKCKAGAAWIPTPPGHCAPPGLA